MTFTYEAYRDVLDAMGEDIREPRRIGERSRTEEVITRLQGPDPRVPEWPVRPDVPARMQQAAIARSSVGAR